MRFSRHRPATTLAIFLSALVVSSCDDASGSGGGAAWGVGGTTFGLPVPEPVLSARSIEVDALDARIRVDGQEIESERVGDVWRVEIVVPASESVFVEVDWIERVDGRGLLLASWSDTVGPLSSDLAVEIDPGDYRSDVDLQTGRFDRDGDGVSNLDERLRGTDPFVRDAPAAGDVTPERPSGPLVTINRFDPARAGTPDLDGRFEDGAIWEVATFRVGESPSDEFLLIDNLLIDGNPDIDDAPRAYQWFAMHDGTYLYLYVVFESGELTPFRDSGDDFVDDDMLHLLFDGDGSGGRAFDGVDDRHVVVPLLPLDGEATPRPFVLDGFSSSARQELDLSLGFGVCACMTCGCRVDEVSGRPESAWEVRLRLDELGILVGREFGLEIQLDQDIDGMTRESRWGWASPAAAERREGDPDIESPALFGRVVLAP